MHLRRVIPCLDVDAGRVVKGTNFVDIRDAGDPVELAERYDREGADELVFLDITATHERRDTVAELGESIYLFATEQLEEIGQGADGPTHREESGIGDVIEAQEDQRARGPNR